MPVCCSNFSQSPYSNISPHPTSERAEMRCGMCPPAATPSHLSAPRAGSGHQVTAGRIPRVSGAPRPSPYFRCCSDWTHTPVCLYACESSLTLCVCLCVERGGARGGLKEDVSARRDSRVACTNSLRCTHGAFSTVTTRRGGCYKHGAGTSPRPGGGSGRRRPVTQTEAKQESPVSREIHFRGSSHEV